jgi:YaiO family outer membrane protein
VALAQILGLCALTIAAPAAETGQLVPAVPPVSNARDVLESALEARAAGDHAKAIALFEAADRERPNDPTILRLLGTGYAYVRRFEEAIAVLQRARAIAPRDQDIALALARAQLWSGAVDAAADTAEQIARDDTHNPELPVLAQAINRARNADPGFAPRPLVAVTKGLSWVRADNGTGARWHDTIGTIAVPLAPRTTLSIELERESRTSLVDVRGQTRLDRRFDWGSAYIAAGATIEADFRERWGVRAGGEVAVAPMLQLTGDVRYAEFAAARVVAIDPGVRFTNPSDRWAIAVRSINLWDEQDEHRQGWALRGEFQAVPRLRLTAGGATYPDTEAGVTRRLRAAFGSVVFGLNERIVLRATFEHEDRRDSFVRNSGVIGISVRL